MGINNGIIYLLYPKGCRGFMCIVCKDWKSGRLTNQEALKNLGELINSIDEHSKENLHYVDLYEKILDNDLSIEDLDKNIDYWYNEPYDKD